MLNQWINISLYAKKASNETITGTWTFDSPTTDVAALIANTDDTTGFARIQTWQINGVDFLVCGTVFGINGFINQLNNSFFFGNANALHFYLINTATNTHTLSVFANNYDFETTRLNLGSKNLATTGVFTNGTTPVDSSHNHTGTGNEGSIVPHVGTQPARALDTIYTNSGVRPIIVYGSVDCYVSDGGDDAYIELKTDSGSPPTTIVQSVGPSWRGSSTISEKKNFYHGFYMVVQPSHKYEIVTNLAGGGIVTLLNWNEVDF